MKVSTLKAQTVRLLSIWCVVALLAKGSALGCSCNYDLPPLCQELRAYKGSALFVGVATDIRYRKVNFGKTLVRQQVVSFAIEDAFAGIQGKSVTVASFAAASMCGYPFHKGRTYLVDAIYESNEALGAESYLSVNSCGMTTSAAYAEDSIRFLRTLRQNPRGGILFGTVKQYVKGSTFVSLNNKPIAGSSVLLQAARMGFSIPRKESTTVDSKGWYEFVGLPEGIYTVTTGVPSGFAGTLNHTVEIQRDGCAQLDVRAHAPRRH